MASKSKRSKNRRVRPALEKLSHGDIHIDLENRWVRSNGQAGQMRPKEAKLLAVFLEHPGETLTREFLMKEVWETDYFGDTRTLEVHVCWLRKKIEKNSRRPRFLRTVRGVGYRFEFPPDFLVSADEPAVAGNGASPNGTRRRSRMARAD